MHVCLCKAYNCSAVKKAAEERHEKGLPIKVCEVRADITGVPSKDPETGVRNWDGCGKCVSTHKDVINDWADEKGVKRPFGR